MSEEILPDQPSLPVEPNTAASGGGSNAVSWKEKIGRLKKTLEENPWLGIFCILISGIKGMEEFFEILPESMRPLNAVSSDHSLGWLNLLSAIPIRIADGICVFVAVFIPLLLGVMWATIFAYMGLFALTFGRIKQIKIPTLYASRDILAKIFFWLIFSVCIGLGLGAAILIPDTKDTKGLVFVGAWLLFIFAIRYLHERFPGVARSIRSFFGWVRQIARETCESWRQIFYALFPISVLLVLVVVVLAFAGPVYLLPKYNTIVSLMFGLAAAVLVEQMIERRIAEWLRVIGRPITARFTTLCLLAVPAILGVVYINASDASPLPAVMEVNYRIWLVTDKNLDPTGAKSIEPTFPFAASNTLAFLPPERTPSTPNFAELWNELRRSIVMGYSSNRIEPISVKPSVLKSSLLGTEYSAYAIYKARRSTITEFVKRAFSPCSIYWSLENNDLEHSGAADLTTKDIKSLLDNPLVKSEIDKAGVEVVEFIGIASSYFYVGKPCTSTGPVFLVKRKDGTHGVLVVQSAIGAILNVDLAGKGGDYIASFAAFGPEPGADPGMAGILHGHVVP